LRKRVVGALGPLLKYRDGRPVGPDVAAWARDQLRQQPAVLTQWSSADPNLAERWVSADPTNAAFVAQWAQGHADDVARWRKDHPGANQPTPAELAALFFGSYATGGTKDWPQTDGKDLTVAFFETWWRAHPQAEVQPVPADMVMASGSGLDPHLTLDSALYQLDRVAAKWAEQKGTSQAEIKSQIETLLRENASSPLGGLAGAPRVNVLEANLALRRRFGP
jgi:K+-transporting ATPase ATPase C chain